MNPRASAFVLAGLLLGSVTAASAAPAPNSADWLPVDQDVWAIMMEEPAAHLAAAQEALAAKNVKGAAAEIRRADFFLKIQEKRLAVSSNQLNALAKDIETGKVVLPKEVDDTFNSAIAALDHRQAVIPVMAGAETMYIDEADYHLTQAKKRLSKKDNKAAAGDIRTAEAYLKLKAVHAGEKAKRELLSSAAELETLAGNVETGGAAMEQDLDKASERARKAVRSAL